MRAGGRERLDRKRHDRAGISKQIRSAHRFGHAVTKQPVGHGWLRPVFLGTAILAFGIPPLAVMLYPIVQLPVLIFQHANVALPKQIDRRLAWLIATPAMHVVHHSRWMPETNSNYSTFLSLWDRIFCSFRTSTPLHGIGLDGCDDERSQSVLGLFLEPLRFRPTVAGSGTDTSVDSSAV